MLPRKYSWYQLSPSSRTFHLVDFLHNYLFHDCSLLLLPPTWSFTGWPIRLVSIAVEDFLIFCTAFISSYITAFVNWYGFSAFGELCKRLWFHRGKSWIKDKVCLSLESNDRVWWLYKMLAISWSWFMASFWDTLQDFAFLLLVFFYNPIPNS